MRNPRGLTSTKQRVYEEFPPSSDWSQDSNSHFLLVDLPGFKREEIKVRVDNMKKLSISGERQVSENKYSRFKQIYQMPDDSDVDAVNGRFDSGVLFIIIPKKKADTMQHAEAEIPGEMDSKKEEKVESPLKDDDKSHSAEKRDKRPEVDVPKLSDVSNKGKQGKEEPKISDKKPEEPKISDAGGKGRYEKKDKQDTEKPKIGDKKPEVPKVSDDGGKGRYEKKDKQVTEPKLSDYVDKGKYGKKDDPRTEESKFSHAEFQNELSKVKANIKDFVNKGKEVEKDEAHKVKEKINDHVTKHGYEKKDEQTTEPKKDDKHEGSSDIQNAKKEFWAGIEKVEDDLRKVADKVKNKEEMQALVKTTMENIIQNKKIIITAMVAFSIGFCISRKLK